MNTLEQGESLLIGSSAAIEQLSQQEQATILVVSDSHGASRMLSYVLRERGSQSDALVFCGDGIGDVCAILSAAGEDAACAQSIPPVIAVVEGNNDLARYPLQIPTGSGPQFRDLKIPLNQTLMACSHRLFISHGHRYSLYDGTGYLAAEATSLEAELALYGHTHIAMAESSSGILTLNPGSCARPRGGLPPSFMTLTLKKGSPYFDYSFYRITGAKSVPFKPEPRIFF